MLLTVFAVLGNLIGLIIPVVTVLLGLSVVWAIWRMTWAHEKVERHVAEIARLMATRTGGAS